ncbi:hypothetical protein [Acinetobacter chengduensis]|uniref:Uncharacterized protein n=1 Tax=Acinetobacter chengduensis TaxID=2420890 RepID=A0ABX9TTL7_9GAMM|nr:hypothetical protein [Acinetobacter chengduensis]RLL19005.1 hypothetical protein D9K81_14715 [Acinetobacter chengduensis]
MMEWRESRKSSLESVKGAIGRLLIDFKLWTMPDTKAFKHWKDLPIRDAIKVAPSRMIDDVDGMLAKYRQQETTKGYVAPLPVLFVAIAQMVSPPEVSAIRGTPYWVNTTVPTDPQNRKVKLRTIPHQFRIQLAFVCAEGDTCQSVINQFCAYMTDDFKRRIKAVCELGDGVKDEWDLTILENSLYPDSIPTGQNNMSVNTVDFQVAGLIPQVVGLYDEDGKDEYGEGVDMGGRDPFEFEPGKPQEWGVIVEADLKDETLEPSVLRASVDSVSGERKVERVKI